MAPTVHPSPVNDFLPARVSRSYDDAGEDDFDMARFSAIRKEQKDEMERVDHIFNSSHAHIEGQIRAENDQLFQHFQLGMQQFYTDLTKTMNANVENKVRLRLEQERLRAEHEAKKAEVNNKYHNEASKLIISTSPQGARQPRPLTKLPSQGLVPSQGPIPSQVAQSNRGPSPSQPQGFASSRGVGSGHWPVASSVSRSSSQTATNGNHQITQAPSSLNKAQSSPHQRVQSRSLTNDDQSRERVLPQAPRHEYIAQIPTPLPTPEERVPLQRRPVPSEQRPAEHRAIEPRPVEPRPVEQRQVEQRPVTQRAVEQRPVEQRQVYPVEPRPVEQRQVYPVESRPVEQRPAEPRPAAQSPVEQRPAEQRPAEQRPAEQRPVQQRPVETHSVERHPAEKHQAEQRPAEQHPAEQRPAEQRPAEQRPAEQRPAEQRPAEKRPVEQRPVEQHHVEQRPVERLPDEQGTVEPHSMGSGAVEARPVEQRPVEQGPVEPRTVEERPLPQSHREDIQTGTPPRPDNKRKAAEPTANVNAVSASKRPRTGNSQTELGHEQPPLIKQSPRSTRHSESSKEPLVQRSISFQEVYQDGKAQFKHKIFPWPKDSNNYYIVRCDEHQVHFNIGNPIHGAAKHVHSPQHGGLEKKHDLAIQICGHHVTKCTAELAELNNKEFKRALAEDNYQVFNMNLLTKEGKRRLTDSPVTKVADTTAKTATRGPPNNNTVAEKKKKKALNKPLGQMTPPKECEFHLGWWSPTKKWYMLIVLPIREDGSLREVGLKERLQETDLMSNVPKCYSTSRLSLQIKGFQAAYADGGPKADKREYPVMFFDSRVQRHALAWLPASRLRQVDLFNPPDNADERQVSLAREWYATRMMHRSSWDHFRRLGPGETPSPTSSEGEATRSEQWLSLRSARTDEMSPIHDKSNGPGHFFASGSSDAGSSDDDANDDADEDVDDDEDDFMKMDIGPIPEPADSNYVEEDSDVEMEGVNGTRPGRRGSNWTGNRRIRSLAQETNVNKDEAQNEPTSKSHQEIPGTDNGIHVAGLQQTSGVDRSPPDSSNPRKEADAQDGPRDSVQAKAVAAMLEADSRSRASSENPEAAPQQSQTSKIRSRPPFADHNRSRSEDTLGRSGAPMLTSAGTSKLNEAQSVTVAASTDAEAISESHAGPWEKFEAIRAARAQLGRTASAPVRDNNKAVAPSSPPCPPTRTGDVQKNSSKASQVASPPLSQSSTVVPARSLSTTPTNGVESGRNTPKIVIPDAARWKVVRGNSGTSLQEPRASSGTPSGRSVLSGKSAGTPMTTPSLPETQLGTPIHDKSESFDVSQFEDSDGIKWTRAGPASPFLRLVTDSMRKWAETKSGSPVKTTIEPAQIRRIVTEHPDGSRDKLRIHLVTKVGRKMMLMFEVNSANGRSQGAGLQGRKFVSWVKANNEHVEWIDDTGSRPDSRRETSSAERSVTVK